VLAEKNTKKNMPAQTSTVLAQTSTVLAQKNTPPAQTSILLYIQHKEAHR